MPCATPQPRLAALHFTPNAQAAARGRVFLTRDTRLAARRDCVAAAPYLLSTDDAAQQLREVAHQWGLRFDSSRAMSRWGAGAEGVWAAKPNRLRPMVPLFLKLRNMRIAILIHVLLIFNVPSQLTANSTHMLTCLNIM